MIVVDTNIIAYLLIPNDQYTQLAIDVFKKDGNWLAPALWQYEFLNVLAFYHRKSLIDADTLKSIYGKASEIIETREVSNIDLLFNSIETSKLSAYDCHYVVLASENNLPLITEDKKILSEFPKIAISSSQFISLNE